MMRKAKIQSISYYLPEEILDNETLVKKFPNWTAEKIANKTGVKKRHIASSQEYASDLAYQACVKLFEAGACSPKNIEFILLCTQSPDYFLPTTACILQNRLGIPVTSGALDFNLGCSGYIYGLSLAKGLIESGQVSNVLLITAETYSKYLNENDISTRAIFGDAAAATYIDLSLSSNVFELSSFIFGTDGSGEENLILREGASKLPSDNLRNLLMNGSEIFSFTIKMVPKAMESLLNKAELNINEVDYFIFHQANEYMLTHLRDKINIPKDKFYINLESSGNTVSSSIPIALKDALSKNFIKVSDKIALVGFGVGYSWGACLLQFNESPK